MDSESLNSKLYCELPPQPDVVMEGLNLNEPVMCSNFYDTFLIYASKSKKRRDLMQVVSGTHRNANLFKRQRKHSTIRTRKGTKLAKAIKNRERKRKALSIPRDSLKYASMLGLHDIWLGYMRQIISCNTKNGCLIDAGECLLRADFHGARLRVTASRCPSYVNTEGIVIFETQRLFKILEPNDQLKTIPKKGSQFTTQIDSLRIQIIGTNFLVRPADRVKYKFKGSRCTTEL